MDVATLGIRVDSTGAVQELRKLDTALADTGKGADASRAKFDAWQKQADQVKGNPPNKRTAIRHMGRF